MGTHRASGPSEFLAVLPHLAGVPIDDSVVLVPFTGARSAGAMRVDRAPFLTDPAGAATHVVGMVCNLEQADGLVLVLSTPNPTGDAGEDIAALLELAAAADRAGHEVRDVLLVTATEWVSLTAHTRGPLPVVPATLDGRALLDPQTAGRLPDPDPAARVQADARRSAGIAVAAVVVDQAEPDAALALLATALDGNGNGNGNGDCDGADGPGWGVLVRLGVLRTTAMLLAGWGPDAAASVWPELGGGGPMSVDSFGVQALSGGNIARPDAARLERFIGLLMAAAGGASEDERADLAAVLAWTHWAVGRSSVAGRLAAAALQRNPGHDLAVVVAAHVHTGRLPEWAFRAHPRA